MIKNIWQLLGLIVISVPMVGAAITLQKPEILILGVLASSVFIVAQNYN